MTKLSYFMKNVDAWQPLMSVRYMTEDPFMSHLEAIRRQFADLVEKPEDDIELVEAALLIARTAFPDLSVSDCTEFLNRWAERLRKSLGDSPSAGDILIHLNRILFDEEGFRGNRQNYYDPQNSFLNRVLERKLGIPISLSLIYSEVGRRAGFPVHGIALPGHFIVGLLHASGTLFIDPFNRGEILTEKECQQRIEARYGRPAALDKGWKTPATKKEILRRVLRNLKAIYRHLNQDLQSFEMIQWILAVDPDAPAELKERGLLYEAMGNDAFAVRDLERYLEVDPTSDDNDLIAQKIELLRQSQRRTH
ncbi:MAG: transglutaminase-like domain-containing protein [Desulfobacteraceae bacterium]|jgi:regulator of sirC expression with transglutaminase-like and TPR domain